MTQDKCFFTNKNTTLEGLTNYDAHRYNSEGCGKYLLNREVSLMCAGEHKLSDSIKLNCASETVKLNEAGLTPFWFYNEENTKTENVNIVIKNIKDFEANEIEHSKKTEGILKILAGKLTSQHPFKKISFTNQDMYKLKIADKIEFIKWFQHLFWEHLVEASPELDTFFKTDDKQLINEAANNLFRGESVGLSTKGWQYIEENKIVSNYVFIAMAFTDNNKNEIPKDLRNTLRMCCENLGWEVKIVDEEEHNNGIMDKVIALMNRASFTIAELTHQKSGVYYEAGYAKGRGLPVIHIVREDDFNECHFDVKHLNLVVWKDFEDLKKKLTSRIEATIGVN